MQRWIKLPSGAYLDASRICFVSKVDTFPRLDADGNADGTDYAITIGTDLGREHQMMISGTGEEIKAVMKSILAG